MLVPRDLLDDFGVGTFQDRRCIGFLCTTLYPFSRVASKLKQRALSPAEAVKCRMRPHLTAHQKGRQEDLPPELKWYGENRP